MRNVHNEFETAVFSMRSAFKAALDDPNFNQSTLSEVWRHYLGMKSILDTLSPSTEGDTILGGADDSSISFSALGSEFYAAGPVDYPYGGAGQDVITFGS
jgi:hypothetical protein